jgi:hypothetical protein
MKATGSRLCSKHWSALLLLLSAERTPERTPV